MIRKEKLVPAKHSISQPRRFICLNAEAKRNFWMSMHDGKWSVIKVIQDRISIFLYHDYYTRFKVKRWQYDSMKHIIRHKTIFDSFWVWDWVDDDHREEDNDRAIVRYLFGPSRMLTQMMACNDFIFSCVYV